MARIQLALNVTDVDAAVDFYTRLLGAPPAKRRPGYANFAVADPPLKLVLVESAEAGERLNHLGIEVGASADVAAADRRLRAQGLETATEDETTCCYAVQDKTWVTDPDGAPWEVYAVLADTDEVGGCSVELPAPVGSDAPARACACG